MLEVEQLGMIKKERAKRRFLDVVKTNMEAVGVTDEAKSCLSVNISTFIYLH